MKFFGFDRNSKKQRIQLGALLLLTCLGLFLGFKASGDLERYSQAEQCYRAGDQALFQSDFAGAAQNFRQAIEVYPEFYAAWEGLALSYHSAGDFLGEAEVYRQALQVLPGRGELHRDLAVSYHRQGNHAGELEHAQIASQILGPDDFLSQRMIERAQLECKSVVSLREEGKVGMAPGR